MRWYSLPVMMVLFFVIPIAWANVGDMLTIQGSEVLLLQNPNSKQVIKKLAPNQSILVIFQQGDWVKVADPRNGDVGWIQKSTVSQAATNNKAHSYTIMEKDADGKVIKTYHVTEYNTESRQALSNQKIQKIFEQIHAQQTKMQEYIHKMIEDSFKAFEQMN